MFLLLFFSNGQPHLPVALDVIGVGGEGLSQVACCLLPEETPPGAVGEAGRGLR